jgi:diamine N-acetyltransferase
VHPPHRSAERQPQDRSAVPFCAERWTLATARGASAQLVPIDASTASSLATAFTDMDPWKRMGYRPDAMAVYLAASEPGTCRRAVVLGGHTIGAVCVRHPWLRGPYLELLALTPQAQGLGLGAAVLDWMGSEVAGRANSLWVCTSTFNVRALGFYQRHGFAHVGDLDGLVGAGFTEILLRKRLSAGV